MMLAQDAPWRDIIGVDVAKGWADVHWRRSGRAERVEAKGPALARWARQVQGGLVVLEASGGYERPLLAALARTGVAFALVNPGRARAFAQATGRLAKTDRVDARVLADMGHALDLQPSPPPDPERARLAQLVARREDLVTTVGREMNRLAQAADAWIGREVGRLVRVLKAHLLLVERQIAALIAAGPQLVAQARCLRSAPGIGPALAAVLLARLPELGRLTRRQVASLASLAPHAHDSGLHKGRRHIKGGRAEVRRALYLAAFVASRRDPAMRTFRQRLQTAGKPTKLALTACARKLLTTLNAMLRDDTNYRQQAT